ncbi:hypothetical protein EV197_3022 [Aquimarina brevivitae]|uniref:Uncharacterized protein n=1 Tax=Aquimarina brevivitae TaxID=323412 RepID=A0A4Q7NY87_9FLAO|nr:hypothetical protein EV197_3022 [Aquimarina brevivitae]
MIILLQYVNRKLIIDSIENNKIVFYTKMKAKAFQIQVKCDKS